MTLRLRSAGSLASWNSEAVLGRISGSVSLAQSQPWLGLVETAPVELADAAALMPSSVQAVSFSGDVNVVGNLTLAPAPSGTINLLASGSINGTQKNVLSNPLLPYDAQSNPYVWDSSSIELSDGNLDAVPGPAAPLGLATLSRAGQQVSQVTELANLDGLFGDSGATSGTNVVLQSQELLHGSLPNSGSAVQVPLHYGDLNPVHLYAAGGNISGVTLYSAKAAQIVASNDITDVAFYVQNVNTNDVTLVSAGRDIIAYDPNSPLRLAAQATGNELQFDASVLLPGSSSPTAGDIQISGPGTLEVLAGRNLSLGTGSPPTSNGLAVGITSVGNASATRCCRSRAPIFSPGRESPAPRVSTEASLISRPSRTSSSTRRQPNPRRHATFRTWQASWALAN